jgi:integrase
MLKARDRRAFRKAVKEFFAGRDDATLPEQGWPWPWEDSGDLHFHDLRRTATRNLVRAGVPKSVAQQVTGHLDPKVFDRYNITDLVDLEGAAEALDRKSSHTSAILEPASA